MSPVHVNHAVCSLKCVNRNRRTSQLHIHLPCTETPCGQWFYRFPHTMTTWWFWHLCFSLSCGPVSARSMKVMCLFASQFRCIVSLVLCVSLVVVKLLLMCEMWGSYCGTIIIAVLWDVTSCRLAGKYRRFRGTACPHFHIRKNKQHGKKSWCNCWSQFLPCESCVCPDDGSSTFLWKFCIYLPVCMTSHPRRQL